MSEIKEKTKRKTRTTRPIPPNNLEEALIIANVIQMGYNGKPWKPVFIADYVKVTKTSQSFRT